MVVSHCIIAHTVVGSASFSLCCRGRGVLQVPIIFTMTPIEGTGYPVSFARAAHQMTVIFTKEEGREWQEKGGMGRTESCKALKGQALKAARKGLGITTLAILFSKKAEPVDD